MIPQIKKILYATDLSKNSEYAFYYSVDLAKKYGGEIVILHAVEPLSERAFGTRTDKVYHDQQKESLEVIRKRLQKFCKIVEEKNSLACVNLVTKTVVEVGYPARRDPESRRWRGMRFDCPRNSRERISSTRISWKHLALGAGTGEKTGFHRPFAL